MRLLPLLPVLIACGSVGSPEPSSFTEPDAATATGGAGTGGAPSTGGAPGSGGKPDSSCFGDCTTDHDCCGAGICPPTLKVCIQRCTTDADCTIANQLCVPVFGGLYCRPRCGGQGECPDPMGGHCCAYFYEGNPRTGSVHRCQDGRTRVCGDEDLCLAETAYPDLTCP